MPLSRSRIAALGVAVSVPVVLVATAFAAPDDQNVPEEVVVSAQRLNEARASIQTQTGASTYTINAEAIQTIPQADNTLLNQVILRAPGVAQDSFGQLHVRGEHNGLQFRLNGIILPEGISVFGQTLDTRLIDKMTLITGALPAEFGLRTAGIIDLTTKSGILEPHGNVSLYGGSHNTIEPSIFHGGSVGNFSYFVTADFLRNKLGIESPDGSANPLHDSTKQYHGFGYFEYILDPENRISWVLGTSHAKFQIPDRFGAPTLGLTILDPATGQDETDIPGSSTALNENQTEITHYAIVSYQHSQEQFDVQTSLSARYSSLTYFPDYYGDILYQGDGQHAYKRDIAYGWQTDAAYHLNAAHTIRGGVYLQHDKATNRTTTGVLPETCTGAGTPDDPYTCAQDPTMAGFDVPYNVIDNSDETQMIESVYLQDEWKILEPLTVNYGLRFDHFNAFTSGHQVSPRVNFVWKPLVGMTVHAGYSRYFSPPPFELVGGKTISKFLNTSNAPPGILIADPPIAEKANYYDVGIEQRFPIGLTVSVDSYYKQSHDLIDEGQFGAPIILTPFNYTYGQNYGFEFAANYAIKNFSVYANFAIQRDRGKNWESAQFNFLPDDIPYTATHYIDLDHEQQYTGSTGASYLWHYTRFSVDMLYGSGLRCSGPPGCGATIALPSGAGAPNSGHLPYYRQVNLGIAQALPWLGMGTGTAKDTPMLRFDVINVFDKEYQIRNGTGAGVFAPQFGPRRGFFAGVSIPF